MKKCKIYQTVANLGNAEELEKLGPIYCQDNPWLGNGYYFWDGLVSNAKWWGRTHYKNKYMIFSSSYVWDSPMLFDLVGNSEHLKFFHDFSVRLMKKLSLKTIKVATVIEYMKRENLFPYKAIRAEGRNCNGVSKAQLYFDDQGLYYLQPLPKIQICVVDFKTFCSSPFKLYLKVD